MQMRQALRIALAGLIALSVPTVTRVTAADDGHGGDGGRKIHASLIGYEEVPSVSTPASGRFKGEISKDKQSIDYEVSYSGLVGTVQQSHIHFAQKSVNGSIVVWLCQTATTPVPATLPAVAAITPVCPQTGTVTGTITAANVITAGTASQQILAGELDEVIAAIRSGFAYVNVHATPLNPGGEIRGQVSANDDDKGKDKN
jgi:hypothetical protein